jgi:putative transferase (TIGR04331 family)
MWNRVGQSLSERRLWLHDQIGLLARRIEQDFSSGSNGPEALSLDLFVRSGALRYWLCNFLDIAHARWELACEDEVLTNNAYEELNQRSRSREYLPLMSSLNTASQDSDWNRQIFADIHIYRQEAGALQRDSIIRSSVDQQTNDVSRESYFEETDYKWGQRVRISRTYLPRIAELLLALSLGSLPVRWREPIIGPKDIDTNARRKLDFRPELASRGSFEHFVRSYLSLHLPMSLVEHFAEIQSAVSAKLKRSPRAFFTAQLHVSSDSFLIWSVMQRKHGMRLLLSQHGGLNGQGLVPTRGEEFEKNFADLYLHWGWETISRSIEVPAQINVWGKRRQKSNHLSKLVIITDCTYRLSRRPWASTDDNFRYRRMLLETYGSLEEELRRNSIVRLHHDHDKYDESHQEMWLNEFPSIKLDDGRSSIWALRRQARLLVCTSLGTSEIEQFARNMPTILRLDPKVHALRSSCVALFKDLESVGVVHWSTDSLRHFLRENWRDIDRWWRSDETQSQLAGFLTRFGQCSPVPIRTIRRVITESSTRVQGTLAQRQLSPKN